MKANNKLAVEINSKLATMPEAKKPISSRTGFRIRRVDYSANGWYEATDAHGHTVEVSAAQVKEW
jgi:hypothetical protein